MKTFRTKVTLLALTLTLMLGVLPAWANCTYYTYIMNGRTVVCSQCCFGNQCTINCY